jgi:circadian clock protein KaiB
VSAPSETHHQERAPTPDRLQLTLFVSGASLNSTQTVRRLRDLCDRHCTAGYDLEIVDIYQQSAVAIARGVLAVPTLIKELPLPVRVLIGDFTDVPRVLAALGLPPRGTAEA